MWLDTVAKHWMVPLDSFTVAFHLLSLRRRNSIFFVHSSSVLVIIVTYSACIKDLMRPDHYLHIHCWHKHVDYKPTMLSTYKFYIPIVYSAFHTHSAHRITMQMSPIVSPVGLVSYWNWNGFIFIFSLSPGCFWMYHTCGHMKSVQYFESSLLGTNAFVGRHCDDDDDALNNRCSERTDRFGVFGKHSHGRFYFQTSSCYPYCWKCRRWINE